MQVRKNRKRRYAAPIGGLFLLLAAIGIVAVVVASLNLTSRVLDNTSEKEMFEEIISPVLMWDPVPFDRPEDIQMDRLLLYSMWATLLSGNYDFEAEGEILIPASDLDVAANRLFATEEGLTLEHGNFSFGDYLSTFYYVPEVKSYAVPVSAELYVYSPSVEDVVKVGDYYRLTVGYLPPGTAWTTIFGGGGKSEPTPDKHMYYYMVRGRDGYQLARVEHIPSEAAAQAAALLEQESEDSAQAAERPAQ